MKPEKSQISKSFIRIQLYQYTWIHGYNPAAESVKIESKDTKSNKRYKIESKDTKIQFRIQDIKYSIAHTNFPAHDQQSRIININQ